MRWRALWVLVVMGLASCDDRKDAQDRQASNETAVPIDESKRSKEKEKEAPRFDSIVFRRRNHSGGHEEPASTSKLPMSYFGVKPGGFIEAMRIFEAGEFYCRARDLLQRGEGVNVDCSSKLSDISVELYFNCRDHVGETNAMSFSLSSHRGKDWGRKHGGVYLGAALQLAGA